MSDTKVFLATGGSMRPLFSSGEPVWAVPISNSEALRPGDIVIYTRARAKFMHRVLSVSGDTCTVFSDSAVCQPHTISVNSIIAKPISRMQGTHGLLWGLACNAFYQVSRFLKHRASRILSVAAVLTIAYCLLPLTSQAYTRVKTVEFNFGGYYSATNVASWTPPYVTINLPDAIASSPIKDAVLDIQYQSIPAVTNKDSPTTAIDVLFSTGNAAGGAAIDGIGTGVTMPTSSRKNDIMCLRFDATSKMTAWSNTPYSMKITLTGSNGILYNLYSAKLFITYYYDDTATTQVKTVHFPLFSTSADGKSGVASYLAQRGNTTSALYYDAEIPEISFTRKQAWFEVRGYRQSGGSATDGTIYAKIGANAKQGTTTLDGSMTGSYWIRYLTSTGTPAGFAENTYQTLNVVTATNATMNVLGGELVETYEYNATTFPQEKTLNYFLCQSTGGASDPANFTVPLYINESTVTIKRIYALMYGSYNNTGAALNLTVNSKIKGQALTARTYSLATTVTQASGFVLYHDLTQGATWWVNGSSVTLSWNANANLGGIGAELIVTYTYNNDDSFTDSYRIWGGETTNQVTNGTYYNSNLNLYFPDPEVPTGKKTLRSAFFRYNFIQGDSAVTANPQTTIGVNGSVPDRQVVQHYGTTENFHAVALYDFTKNITPASTTVAGNFTLSNDPFNTAGIASVIYEYKPVPVAPSALTQYQNDDVTIMPLGDWENLQGKHLRFTFSSKITGDSLYPVVEVKPAAGSFDGITNLSTGTVQTYNGSSLSADIFISTGQGAYQWRASVVGSAGRSAWTNFGAPGTTHFGIDLSTPAIPVLATPSSGTATSDQTPTLTWNALTDTGGSGLSGYLLQIATSTNFNPVFYSSITANTSFTSTFTWTQAPYYWRTRSQDAAGNFSAYSDTWTIIIDSTPPLQVTTYLAPANQAFSSSTIQTFSWASSTDTPAGVQNYILQLSTAADFSAIAYSSVTVSTGAVMNITQSSYTWRVNVQDWANNYTTSTLKYSVVIDSSPPPPVTTISTPSDDSASNVQLQTFNWTGVVSLPAPTKAYFLQVSTAPDFSVINYSSATATNSAQLTLNQSSYTWRVNVQDYALNYTTSPAVFHVIVDTTQPAQVTNYIAPGNQVFSSTTSTTFSWSASTDTPAGIKNYILQLSTAPDFSGTIISSTTPALSAQMSLSQSSYTWRVNAQDWANNYTTSTLKYSVVIDSSPPPQITTLSTPSNGLATNTQTQTFSWVGVASFPAPIQNYILQLSTAANFTGTIISSVTAATSAVLTLNQSSYTWRVNVQDYALNYTTSAATFNLVIDTTPPPAVSTLLGPSPDGLASATTTQVFSWTGVTDTPALVKNYIVQVSTAGDFSKIAYSSVTANTSATIALIQSSYTWRVNVQDYALNYTTSPSVYHIVIDTTPPPAVSTLNGPANNVPVNNLNQTFSWTGVTDLPSMLKNYIVQLSTASDFSKIAYSSVTALNNATISLNQSSYTWRVNVQDYALNYTTSSAVFFVLVDTTLPVITNLQAGDATWRSAPGNTYNVQFGDQGFAQSKLNSIQYEVITATGFTAIPWTDIAAPPINQPTYVTPWQVNFNALVEAVTNFVSIRATDLAGNTSTYTNAFYVLKDVSVPSIVDNQFGDTIWRNAAGATYDLDFFDNGGSGIDHVNYSDTYYVNNTPGASVFTNRTLISQATLNATTSYITTWQIPDFNLLLEGKNFIGVTVYDRAGLSQTLSSYPEPFYILKDTTAPTIINGQAGDNTWRPANTGQYNVDFQDASSGSGVAGFDMLASTVAGGTQSLLIPWTQVLSTNTYLYTQSWPIPDAVFTALRSGHEPNRISLRTYDFAANTSAVTTDAFYILKDTIPPTMSNNQAGDNTWRTLGGTTYNVGFADAESWAAGARYTVRNGPTTGDTEWAPSWQPIFSSTGTPSYNTNWQLDFNSLWGATNYVFVQYWDVAGTTITPTTPVFYIKKDNVAPTVQNNQSGDNTWRNAPGTAYDVDFQDSISGVSQADYMVKDAVGNTVIPWTNIFTNPAGQASYTTNWALSVATFTALLDGASNFVYVRDYDVAGNLTAPVNPQFYILKDTDLPTVQLGAQRYFMSSHDLGLQNYPDFFDPKNSRTPGASGLASIQYYISTGTAMTGTAVENWTSIAGLTPGTTWFTNQWSVNFAPLPGATTCYVSVQATDLAGNTTIFMDAFRVFKSTIPAPVITDNQTGDYTWYTSSNSFTTKQYDVDFRSFDNDNISSVTVQSWSGLAQTGSKYVDWTAVVSTGTVLSYTQNWTLTPAPFTGFAPEYIWNLLHEGTNYITVQAYDMALDSSTKQDAFFVLKDTNGPTITNNQSGDLTWRNAVGTTYNVDFQDLISGTTEADYLIKDGSGNQLLGWTPVFTNSGGVGSYTTDWPISAGAFTALPDGSTGYVYLRSFDKAGNATTNLTPSFYILKDTDTPFINVAAQKYYMSSHDFSLKNYAGFFDPKNSYTPGASGLNTIQYFISTGTAMTGTPVKNWTTIPGLTVGTTWFTNNWQIDFASLPGAVTCYVSLSAADLAGNTSTFVDAFRVFKSTIAAPVITDNQTGDYTWYTSSNSFTAKQYDVDFQSFDNDYISSVTVQAWSGLAQSGSKYVDWTAVVSTGTVLSYTQNWALSPAPFTGLAPEYLWNLLHEGTNYITVQAYDMALDSTTKQDAFFVLKDTNGPTITNNQSGDNTWRNTVGTTYNVDFQDLISGTTEADYMIKDGSNNQLLGWTPVFTNAGGVGSYTTDWPISAGAFTALPDGSTGYVYLRSFDKAGNATTNLTPSFYILKDTDTPFINVAAQKYYMSSHDFSLKNYATFFDPKNSFTPGASGLNAIQYFISTGTAMTGTPVKNWTTIPGLTVGTTWFTNNWQIDFAALPGAVTCYVSVSAADLAGNTSTFVDAFRVFKSTIAAPVITDNQSGDYTWYTSSNSFTAKQYDVDFQSFDNDYISSVTVQAWSGLAQSGSKYVDWTAVVSTGTVLSYTQNWALSPAPFTGLAPEYLWNLLHEGTNYITVQAYDMALDSSTKQDAFFVLKDTNGPTITNNQSGDNTWRNTVGTTYNVDFQDLISGTTEADYMIKDGSNNQLLGWTPVFTNSGGVGSYTTDWPISAGAFTALPDGSTGYVYLRSFDKAGNATTNLTPSFYILKDTDTPFINVAAQKYYMSSHDFSLKNYATFFDPKNSFTPGASGLNAIQYFISTGTAMTGTPVKNWTTIPGLTVGTTWFTNNWQIDFAALPGAVTCYVSVSAADLAGNTSTFVDAFRVFKSTIAAPVITDNQTGDYTWYTSSNSFTAKQYDVDFQSFDNDYISSVTVQAWSGLAQSGSKYVDWTAVVSTGTVLSYTQNWALSPAPFTGLAPEYLWNLLHEGTNYITVQAYDMALDSTTKQDAFFVLKDTNGPTITNNQSGDNTWRNAVGTVYNVDFQDLISGTTEADYLIKDGSGNQLFGWTPVFTNAGGVGSYTTDWPISAGAFAALPDGSTGYVYLRSFDKAGNVTTNALPSFYILKDTDVPTVQVNGQTFFQGAYQFGAIHDVDFFDPKNSNTPGASGLSSIQYFISTGPAMTGTVMKNWTSIPGLVTGSTFYTTNWAIDYTALTQLVTGYVSVQAVDQAGNTTTYLDAFRVLKTTATAPLISNNQTGDFKWYGSSTAMLSSTYNMSFQSIAGPAVYISSVSVQIYSKPGSSGTKLVDWTTVVSTGNVLTYSVPWQLKPSTWTTQPDYFWNLMQEGTNYISVQVLDINADSATATDAFFIRKDTTTPGIINNQTGDNVWRNTAAAVYDVDINDLTSGTTEADYKIMDASKVTTLVDWTPFLTNPTGVKSQTANWGINPADFAQLPSGATSYVYVRAFDLAGNTTQPINAQFYILKDTNVPTVSVNASNYYLSSRDFGTQNYAGFYDPLVQGRTPGASGLNAIQYFISTGTAMTGTPVKNWTAIPGLTVGTTWFTNNWQIDFASLPGAVTCYVSLSAADLAGNTSTFVDAFRVFKSTIAAPVITDNQSGDYTWYTSSNSFTAKQYDVDFQSFDNDYISSVTVQAWSGLAQSGSKYVDWTAVVSTGTVLSYTQNWALSPAPFTGLAPEYIWNLLHEGTNYITVQAYDMALDSSTKQDAFFVLKDTNGPTITNNQSGDNTWRNVVGTVYNVDFQDLISGTTEADYLIKDGSGNQLFGWTPVFTNAGGVGSYTTDWPISAGAFTALPDGSTGYVYLRSFDKAGNATTNLTPSFYILKDTDTPFINVAAQKYYMSSHDFSLKNYATFFDPKNSFTPGVSGLNAIQYFISTGTAMTGTPVKNWTAIPGLTVGTTWFTNNWQIDFASLPGAVTCYVSLSAADLAGNTSTFVDAFRVFKSTIAAPVITDNQTGDYTWYTSSNSFTAKQYDVDLQSFDNDYISSVTVQAWSGLAQSGSKYVDWTAVVSTGTVLSYTQNWALSPAPFTGLAPEYIWNLLHEGTNYITVQAYDMALDSSTKQDAFFVLKDTNGPTITNNQSGDNTWRNTFGTTYNVDFQDLISGTTEADYLIKDGSGNQLFGWTPVFTNSGGVGSYTTDWPISAGAFAALPDGSTGYVYLRSFDKAGNATTNLTPSFFILKDTDAPTVTVAALNTTCHRMIWDLRTTRTSMIRWSPEGPRVLPA